jgi:hypothetical protein
MGLRRLFTEHPASVGESYFRHLWVASGFAARMLIGAIACFLHALFPFAFEYTGSNCINSLHEQMVTKRRDRAARPATPSTPHAARITRAPAVR